ncbi:hypothetical protein BKH42_00220 [Helicobacter sp. 13S00482-2]|uniref:hypothetical protein n=1 Tax=Helicobacter sp. 13S00482-2 TaxID=1476200 RepID=UPI000BA4F5EE|nr:hypothetical protein [Helicobacter sp. 13S00482-2]PAF54379.1 hypothetical protein BKH42_00220 [Helicobacter sp. 13S00482-2]
MIKFVLILGIFIAAIFLLIPNSEILNNLGIITIAIYFFAGVGYLLLILLLWLIFNIKKTPIEILDEYIHKKIFIARKQPKQTDINDI